MMKKTILLTIVFFILSALAAIAQSEKLTKQDKDLLKKANEYYTEGNYLRALEIYKVLAESYLNNAELIYKTGICYLYKTDEKSNSIDFISKAGTLNNKLEDYNFNMGRAYHVNYRFKEAITYFETYISEKPSIIKKNLAEHYIEFCKNGEVISAQQNNMIIDNIGPPINTENAEYVPVVSADGSVMIFTYKGTQSTGGMMDGNFNPSTDGEYYEDVFISYRIGERWTEPQSIGENINTKGHDASIALSTDGQKLFIFKSTPEDKGDIYMSELSGEVWGVPVKLGPNINTKYWEGSVSLSADELTLYFASERPGGLGGRDIYKSEKQPNGEWGEAVNLGAEVNTAYDEDAPFIHPDGITLFFSSKGHNSMGGYDIFYSTNKTGEWSAPVNMSAPINTTDDDLYYVLSPDGETGYYSSNRKEGYGQQDIYVITPGIASTKPILALATGHIFINSKPAAATIKLHNAETGALLGSYRSNSATGKYMVTLPPGKKYKIEFNTDKKTHNEYVDVTNIGAYMQLQNDMKLYTDEYAKQNNIAAGDSTNTIQKSYDLQLQKYNAEKDAATYEARINNDIVTKRGTIKKDNITYNVDMGTYETATDFDESKFSDLGKIQNKLVTQGTTFYIAGFPTLNDAQLVRNKAIERDKNLSVVSQITVTDLGTTKTLPDYFSAFYSRPDYKPSPQPKVVKTKLVEQVITEDKNRQPKLNKKPKGLTEVPTQPAAIAKREIPTPCDTGKTYDLSALAGKSLNDPLVYDRLMNIAGTMCGENLQFNVQIGAYRHPDNFKYSNLKPMGKNVTKSDAVGDAISRFTMGEYRTLKDTEKLRQEIIRLGTKDAWITAIYNGKRMTLEELIPLNFYKKGIN
ncbi:MAG: PD40 domain-containing protein [Bacteroidia bacterium]|nr:PD40 domain-containing protein [Bacteroidia bacterium]